jgi:hypothetical protein
LQLLGMAKSQKKTTSTKKPTLAKKDPNKQIGFFSNLPQRTVNEIRRRATKACPQWMVIRNAIDAAKPKPVKKVAKKKAA